MKIKAGLKGRPSKSDHRDMRHQCDYLHCDAQSVFDAHALAAIYLALSESSDKFQELECAIADAAELLFRESETRTGGRDATT